MCEVCGSEFAMPHNYHYGTVCYNCAEWAATIEACPPLVPRNGAEVLLQYAIDICFGNNEAHL